MPEGKDLPMIIVFESKKTSLKDVIELIIETFVKDDKMIISTSDHKDELNAFKEKCEIVDSLSLAGIEAQWLVVTASDQPWKYETLSRARNGLIILLDISGSTTWLDEWLSLLQLCRVHNVLQESQKSKLCDNVQCPYRGKPLLKVLKLNDSSESEDQFQAINLENVFGVLQASAKDEDTKKKVKQFKSLLILRNDKSCAIF